MEASGISSWSSPGFEIVAASLNKVYGDVISVPGLMIAGIRHQTLFKDC
jgi:hypothetical protein